MLLHIACLVMSLLLQTDGGYGYPPPIPDTFVITSLGRQPAAPPGSSAFVRLNVGLDKTQSLVVRAFGLPDGTYEIVRSGWEGPSKLGSFTVDGDGMGKLWVDAPAEDDFFSWYLFYTWIDVRLDGISLFSGYLSSPFGFLLAGDDSGTLQGARLIAVGDDLDARGRLLHRYAPGQYSSELRLERLAPGPYILEVADEPVLFLEVGQNGKGGLRLSSPLHQGEGSADLFPAGKAVRVLDAAGHAVLEARMPQGAKSHAPGAQKFTDLGDGAADGLSVDFVRTGWSALKSGSLAWQRDASGAASLTVHLPDATVSYWPWELYVGDVLIGAVQTPTPEGDALEDSFAVGPDVDLRAQRVEVRAGTQPQLALVFPESVPAGVRAYHRGVRKPHHLHLDLLNPGIDLDATGLVDWRLKAGVETLRLVVHDLPAGAYDIVLDGSVVAAGALVVDEAGGEDEEVFSTASVPGESLPLDFAVHGALEIRAAGTSTTYLQQDLGD